MRQSLLLAGFFIALLTLSCAPKPEVVMDVSGHVTTGAITGVITDGNWHPIPGAYVRVEGPVLNGGYLHAFADEKGRYYIADIPPGNDYTISVRALGHPPVSRSHVRVVAGALLKIPFDISFYRGLNR